MTGPEHYRAAERLLAQGQGDPTEQGMARVAAAQAHAVLALVTVTVQSADLGIAEWTEWRRVTGQKGGGL